MPDQTAMWVLGIEACCCPRRCPEDDEWSGIHFLLETRIGHATIRRRTAKPTPMRSGAIQTGPALELLPESGRPPDRSLSESWLCRGQDATGPMNTPWACMDSLHSRAQREGARAYALSYCRSSCRSSSLATPEIVPVNSPVSVPSTTPPEALNTTGVKIAVNVMRPDAPLNRPVPPVT
jgi:hypothetical protein